MVIASQIETITMADGGTMDAYVAVPESGRGPGMLVVMEVFGVGDYIREATDRLAKHASWSHHGRAAATSPKTSMTTPPCYA